jgi:hypothetical protein
MSSHLILRRDASRAPRHVSVLKCLAPPNQKVLINLVSVGTVLESTLFESDTFALKKSKCCQTQTNTKVKKFLFAWPYNYFEMQNKTLFGTNL